MAKNQARKQHEQGVALFRKGDYQGALAAFEQALTLADGDQHHEAEIYNDIGTVRGQLELYEEAYDAFDEAVDRFIELEDIKGQAQVMGNVAAIYESQGYPEEAVDMYKQAAAKFEEVDETQMAMYVWQAVSRLRLNQKQYIAAIGAYEEGIERMPEGSIKRSILRRLIRTPGSLLAGGGGRSADRDDDDDED